MLTNKQIDTHVYFSSSTVQVCASDVYVQNKRLATKCVRVSRFLLDESKMNDQYASLSFVVIGYDYERNPFPWQQIRQLFDT